MRTLSERLRGPIKHPQQLTSQRIEAADAIDELVAVLKIMQRNGQKQGWNDKYETDMGRVAAILAKHKGDKP